MESRKSHSADLEHKRPVFFQLGLIIAISAALVAFEWKTTDYGNILLPPSVSIDPEVDIIELAVIKKPELPKPLITTILNVVDSKTENIPDIVINTGINPEDKIEPYILPELLPDEPGITEPEIFIIAQDMPVFPGGYAAMLKYLSENTKYPSAAKEAGISGTVYISFIIDAEGRVTSVNVLRSVSGGCTEEAIRVVSEMPRWTPGLQRGKPVKVRMSLPVKFVLLN